MTALMKINLPYVHCDKDSRTGAIRVYFRRRLGAPKIRLRSEPGTEEFLAEYKAALEASQEDVNLGGKPNTYSWLMVRYFESAEFKSLDPQTQRTRRGILESTCLEKVVADSAETFADFPLNRLTSKAIRVLRDRKVLQGFPDAANNRLKAIRRMFAWAVEDEVVDTNPARDVSYARTATSGHHTWTDDEILRFQQRHPPNTKAGLALALLSYTGVRRSDVVRLGRQHMRDGWLKFRTFKGRNSNPVTVEIPVLGPLKEALEAGPTGDMTFLMTEYGRPFTAPGFGNWFRDRCNEAELPHCSAHGLRKAGATLAAENGASTHELMSIFGWLTLQQAERYTRAAQRRKLAARAPDLLVRQSNKTSPQK